MSEAEERTYVIPLRYAYFVPRPKRANKAIKIIREFVKRHLKVEEVLIGDDVNKKVWERNREKPPRRIKVKVKKVDEETAEVRLAQ